MSKHTPGPWEAHVDGFGCSNTGGPYVAVSCDGVAIAHVLCGDRTGSRGDYPFAANARLIAAAPELLEALNRVMQEWNERKFLTLATRQTVDAVIAKAEGRT